METIDALLAPHFEHLLARARRLTRNESDARDLVQDTCLRAIEHLAAREHPIDNMRGWLLVVMRNVWFNAVRHRRISREAIRSLVHERDHDACLSEMRADKRQFQRAWEQLTPRARSVASQCLLEGDSYDDVSRRLGVTPMTIATSIHRTRERLKSAMFGAHVEKAAG